MKKTRLLTLVIATAIILTGCTSGMKYDKAIKLMDEGKYSEAIQIYDKLNDENKSEFNEVMKGYIQGDIDNFNYNEIDTFYNSMSDDFKNGIKDSTKASFEDKINTLTMESKHDKIIDMIEKMNGEIKELSQKDEEYLENDSILNGVEESLDKIYQEQKIKKFDEAIKKLEKVSSNYARLDRVDEVKQELTQKKNETIAKLYGEIVVEGEKYLGENDFENAYKQLKKVRNVVPSKNRDADKLMKEWKEKEAEYIKEQQKIMMAKMNMIASHEASKTETYQAKGSRDGIYVDEFCFDSNVNVVNGKSQGMYLTINCPNELPIYVKGIEFIADGEKCKFHDFNFTYETKEYSLTWAERISKFFLSDELDSLRKFATAKEAKIIIKGKESNMTFIIPKAEKGRLLTSIDFCKIFEK